MQFKIMQNQRKVSAQNKQYVYFFKKLSGIFHTDLYFLQWHDRLLLLYSQLYW
jgi:hypothetical protein